MPDDLETTWTAVCREVRREVTDATFHIWFAPLTLAGRRGDTLLVQAPDQIRSWVEERYLGLLTGSARAAIGAEASVTVVPAGWTEAGAGNGGRNADHRSRVPAAGPTGTGATPPAQPRHTVSRLNPKYTFEQFVIGGGNRLAHAAALAVAEMPGQAYNPLFIHGPPGLGKTHLLHAIGNYLSAYGLGLRVEYVTVEAFTSEFVNAVRRRETEPFRERFRGADVLLVDDVQFLAEKSRTMEEFFHTFNALYESGRQLVLTSDRLPGELGALERRLLERFRSGLVAGVEPPDFDARMAILRKRARLDALSDVDEDTLAAIAGREASSVRSLEGALIRVVAYASLTGEHASPELARTVLSRLDRRGDGVAPQPCTVERIQEATAEAFGIPRATLLAADRRPKVAFARQVAMYLARELTGESLPAIGRGFGGRNHSTVLHACRKIERDVGRHGEARTAVNNLKDKLGIAAG